MMNRPAFDTSKELLVQRYKQGVRLIRPNDSTEEFSRRNLGSLYNSPMSIYFFDRETHIVDANLVNLETVGIQSLKDLIGKKPWGFFDKKFKAISYQKDIDIMSNASMKVYEESGHNRNGQDVSTLSFKFPFYRGEEVVGLFGCSIKIDSNSMTNFASSMSQLLMAGLLSSPSNENLLLPAVPEEDPALSKREREVLSHLIRGKTAKEIGRSLEISKRTVENHLKNLKTKAHCGSKSELINKYIDHFIRE